MLVDLGLDFDKMFYLWDSEIVQRINKGGFVEWKDKHHIMNLIAYFYS